MFITVRLVCSKRWWVGLVDREPNDGTYNCMDGTTSPYTEWYNGGPDCFDDDDHYTFDEDDGMQCIENSYSKRPALCKKREYISVKGRER